MRAFVDHREAHASGRRLLAGGLGAAGALFGAVALGRPAAAQTATTTGGSTATTDASTGSAPATTSAVTAGPAGGTPTSVATTARASGGSTTTVVAATSTSAVGTTGAGGAAPAGASTTVPPRSPQPVDIPFLVFAQSLEMALVSAYDTALGASKLDAESAQVVAIFQRHHREHAQTIGGIAGRTATRQPNPGLLAQYGAQLQSASSQKALLQVLFDLEQMAAATYTQGLATRVGTEPAALTASILPIEGRHAVVLGQALNLDVATYVPTFEPTTGGATPAQFPVQGA